MEWQSTMCALGIATSAPKGEPTPSRSSAASPRVATNTEAPVTAKRRAVEISIGLISTRSFVFTFSSATATRSCAGRSQAVRSAARTGVTKLGRSRTRTACRSPAIAAEIAPGPRVAVRWTRSLRAPRARA